jgi:hypothetical protein
MYFTLGQLQLLLRRENEGRGPIVIKAAEQSTMMEEEDEMTAWWAEPATGQGGAWRTWWGWGMASSFSIVTIY